MTVIRAGTTKRLVNLSLDLNPILQHFQKLGDNNSMQIRDLTQKVCWLLGIAGFMRLDDIHCTDASLSRIEDGRFILTVIFPKEKRDGQRIEKPVIISPHTDDLFCPVKAYLSYRKRTGKEDTKFSEKARQHLKDKQCSITPLIRSIQNRLQPVKNDSISNHMQQIMALIQTPETGPSSAGPFLPPWPSPTRSNRRRYDPWKVVFDSHRGQVYRLSRSTANNLSITVLRTAPTL